MSRLRWEVEGRDWPNRAASRFLTVGPVEWHVQQMGDGPVVVLLHGTGASSHSWRDVMPLLADNYTVIAPDLPGHGFTRGRPRGGVGLEGMATALGELLRALDTDPGLVVGHSAGVAIAMNYLHLQGSSCPVVGFNPAIMPFPGLAARIFPAMAKMLFVNPLAPRIFARMARVPGETGRFLRRATGSRIDGVGLNCYETLIGNARHCEGALAMMAEWNLEALARTLPEIVSPVLLLHPRGDSAVPLSSVEEAARLLPNCRLDSTGTLGHLAHEEDPRAAVEAIVDFALAHDLLAEKEAIG
jgi:magnesium chelatase accessory protein